MIGSRQMTSQLYEHYIYSFSSAGSPSGVSSPSKIPSGAESKKKKRRITREKYIHVVFDRYVLHAYNVTYTLYVIMLYVIYTYIHIYTYRVIFFR